MTVSRLDRGESHVRKQLIVCVGSVPDGCNSHDMEIDYRALGDIYQHVVSNAVCRTQPKPGLKQQAAAVFDSTFQRFLIGESDSDPQLRSRMIGKKFHFRILDISFRRLHKEDSFYFG